MFAWNFLFTQKQSKYVKQARKKKELQSILFLFFTIMHFCTKGGIGKGIRLQANHGKQ